MTARIETPDMPMRLPMRRTLLALGPGFAAPAAVGVASVNNPQSPYRKFWAMVITD